MLPFCIISITMIATKGNVQHGVAYRVRRSCPPRAAAPNGRRTLPNTVYKWKKRSANYSPYMSNRFARSRLRIVVEAGICLLIVFLLLQTWFIDGVAAPCQIAGGSMAETLLGARRDIVCADCGFTFRCDAALPPASRPRGLSELRLR